jgi:hypothetical protein
MQKLGDSVIYAYLGLQVHKCIGMRRNLFESIVLVAILAISVSAYVGTARAEAPTITGVTVRLEDYHGQGMPTGWYVWITVTVRHVGFSATNYVDKLEAYIDWMGGKPATTTIIGVKTTEKVT